MRTTLRHAFLLFAPAVIALFAPTAPGQALPEPIAPPDAWGYEMFDQTTGSCPFQFVDLAGGGSLLTFPAPGDDEGAAFVPTRPFQLYGSPVSGFVASTNGYLAATGSLSAEDGRDYSNDSVPSVPGYVPLVPGTPTASFPARIAVFHDDLALGDGTVRWQEAASCPRPSGAIAGEACTVVQWSGVSRAGGSEPLTFQAILYHSSFAIALQVAASDGSGGGSASAGIQDLRHGSLHVRHPPLPAQVRAFAVAASTRGPRSHASARRLHGDGLVPVASAFGEHTDPARDLAIPEHHRLLVHRTGHLGLLASAQVSRQLHDWLA